MSEGRESRRHWPLAAMCIALGVGLVAVPASAGKGKSYQKEAGTSDPTNVPIVASDLEATVAVWQPEDQIQASAVWSTTTGAGVVVAVLDGGFNLRAPALAGNLIEGYDAISDQPMELPGGETYLAPAGGDSELLVDDGVYTAYDDVGWYGNGYDDDGDGLVDEGLGHGTFAAGMVLRVAPDATILPIRVRDNEGYGLDQWVMRGVDHAVACGADVLSLSIEAGDAWGPGLTDSLNRAAAAGVTIVLSAGNGSNQQVSDMAWTVPSLLVGAVDETDTIAPFSDWFDLYPGQWPARMVFAPGVDLVGPTGFPCDESMAVWSGTSFAAPLVSGAVALVRQARPELNAAEIRDLLADEYDPVSVPKGRAPKYCGRVNVWRAVTR